jgi:hypothetical protein
LQSFKDNFERDKEIIEARAKKIFARIPRKKQKISQ